MKEVTKQVLIGPDQGWKDHVMRLFTLGEDGYAPPACARLAPYHVYSGRGGDLVHGWKGLSADAGLHRLCSRKCGASGP